MALRRVCVFCGSSAGTDPEFRVATERLAREIAHRGLPDLRVVRSMHERKVGSLATRQGSAG